ncbi:MAG TPA: DUF2271 domain-containing protein [Bacteroidia bacterium]|nr:DUF2271 domain-containing protein [Bacteroidia bacterium]
MKHPLIAASLTLAGSAFAGGSSAQANDILLEVEIPQLDVAEYHRPYVAAWIENDQKKHVADLLVWYQTENRSGASERGETWLKDLRKWWRISGRELSMPVDGISGPTKPAGKHKIDLTKAISALPAGSYQLVVEASREVGGRELIALSFSWDGTVLKSEPIQGSSELGAITLVQN